MSEMQGRLIFQKDKDAGVTAYSRKKDEAWETYVRTAEERGEEDVITQFRFYIFVLRCYMGMVKEYVSATKDLINEVNEISEEVNSLVEMDLQSTDRFTYGIEKYPSFMRGFVMRRRAKRYYKEKLSLLCSKISIAASSVQYVPKVLQVVLNEMSSMTTGMTKSMRMIPSTGGKKKKGGFIVPQQITDEIEKRRKGGKGGSDGSVGGSEGGGSVGAAPSGDAGASSGSAGDHWDSDIM